MTIEISDRRVRWVGSSHWLKPRTPRFNFQTEGGAAAGAGEEQGPPCRCLGSSPRTSGPPAHQDSCLPPLSPNLRSSAAAFGGVASRRTPLSRPVITPTTLPSDPQVQARAALGVKTCKQWTDGAEDKEMGAVLGTRSQRKSAETPPAAGGSGGM